MKNDPLVAKLYNKMQQEQNEYRAWLLAQPPEEILNHAYEYSSREDILIALENASLRPAQLRALLESQAPLADIYKDYRDCDTNTLDVMTLCIADRADIDLMESTKKNWPPVYYQTGRYAREHEELPQYRASMKLMTPFLTTITACAWMTVPCSRYWQDTAQSAPAILLQQPSKCGMAMREFPRRIEDGRILCEQFKTSMRMGMTRRCITPICNLMPG